ncbi:MAG TPA: hypothetical protein P5026_08530 [Kiritimatiellia bacterium]|nr:hypothetical protein [Kiritimatiellia bacterium]HRU70980.1 hypothetical protein [Kiritimatiellia bacterium]
MRRSGWIRWSDEKAGMTEIRHAGLQTFSLFSSVCARRRLIFYGE